MKEEKHLEILREVEETLREALQARDIRSHQRRLVAMLSLGSQQVVEIYLHRQGAIRPGAHVKHDWFSMSGQNIDAKISAILTTDMKNIPLLKEMIALARLVEKDRNDQLYGSPLADDTALRKKIGAFLEVKRLGEEHGEKR